MYKGKKILALIPARGGSKGIPNKNIIVINDKPMLAFTTEAASKSKYLDNIVVSTDDDAIAVVAFDYEVNVLRRPAELAQDTSKTIDVVMHAISVLPDYDYLVLLQPTSPLRQTKHIDEAIEKMIDEDLESLVSVSPVRNHPLLLRKIDEDGKMEKILDCSSTVRRQEFDKYYALNGAVYINKIKDLTKETSLNDNKSPYIMEEKYSLEIDEPLDLIIFYAYLSHI